MALANGKNSNVISECSRYAPRSGDSARPWANEEGDESHTKWASLWNATKVPVNFPKAPSNSVAIMQLKMRVLIGSGEPWGEAKQIEQQDPYNLIKTFKSVGHTSREGGAFKLGEFEFGGHAFARSCLN